MTENTGSVISAVPGEAVPLREGGRQSFEGNATGPRCIPRFPAEGHARGKVEIQEEGSEGAGEEEGEKGEEGEGKEERKVHRERIAEEIEGLEAPEREE